MSLKNKSTPSGVFRASAQDISRVTEFVLEDRREWRDLKGRLHNNNSLPAVLKNDGSSFWYVHGSPHREDGPAILRTKSGGVKEYPLEEWFLGGLLHREDGPAVVYPDGSEEWWLHGERHRDLGPAKVLADGRIEWWLDGQRHSDTNPSVSLSETVALREGSPLEMWHKKGRLHRTDGPAVIWPSGKMEWWFGGQRHREGGSAVIYPDGREETWLWGERAWQ